MCVINLRDKKRTEDAVTTNRRFNKKVGMSMCSLHISMCKNNSRKCNIKILFALFTSKHEHAIKNLNYYDTDG